MIDAYGRNIDVIGIPSDKVYKLKEGHNECYEDVYGNSFRFDANVLECRDGTMITAFFDGKDAMFGHHGYCKKKKKISVCVPGEIDIWEVKREYLTPMRDIKTVFGKSKEEAIKQANSLSDILTIKKKFKLSGRKYEILSEEAENVGRPMYGY